MTDNNELELNRPDVSFANRIRAMFIDDPEIEMQYYDATDITNGKLTINVNNITKAAALRHVIMPEYEFGNIILEVEINDTSTYIDANIIEAVFTGNPHFKEYKEIIDPTGELDFHVCIFNKEVIQFKNDNGGSLHGYEFRLMEDLAREVMPVAQLFYTTDDGIED